MTTKDFDIAKFLSSGVWLGDLANKKFFIGYGEMLKVSQVTDLNPGQFYCTDFFQDNCYWLVPQYFITITVSDLRELWWQYGLKHNWTDNSTEQYDWIEPQAELFAQSFNSIQELITNKEICKAVPVVLWRSTTAKANDCKWRWQKFYNLLVGANHPNFHYGFWHQQQGLIGCSPELLFRKLADGYITMALAGTQSQHNHDLLNDAKELHEHELVVNDISAQFSSIGKVHRNSYHELKLPNITHLKTDIWVKTNEYIDFLAMVKLLHPTPALGVYPRTKGYRWLKELPYQKERFSFGAPFGVKSINGEEICIVAIRNLQWQENKLVLGAGCGITARSVLAKEWQELQLKQQAVLRMFL